MEEPPSSSDGRSAPARFPTWSAGRVAVIGCPVLSGNGITMASTKSRIMPKITMRFGVEMESQPHSR